MALIRTNARSASSASNFVGVSAIEFTMSGTSLGQTYVTFEAGARRVRLITSTGGSIYFVNSSKTTVAQEHGTAADTEVVVDLTSYPTASGFFCGAGLLKQFIVEY